MIDISPNDKDVLEQFRKGAIDSLSGKEQKALWYRIEHTVKKSFGKRFRFSGFYPWAAVACVLLLMGFGYWWYNNQNTTPTLLIVETQPKQRQQVILPDSTIVWLNAGSRLEYPESFTDGRFVHLEGEAYFSVAHDASRPFTVHVSGLHVIVLGTIFNVTAYENDTEIVTTLVEGQIALQLDGNQPLQTTLVPNQQVTFHKDTKDLTFATVDSRIFTSWVRGYYKFENTSFEQIAKQFERMHGVKIVFEDESLRMQPYNGTFLQEQSIETVLELLKETRYFTYTIQSNRIIISR